MLRTKVGALFLLVGVVALVWAPVLHGQTAALREVEPVEMPGGVDCNSPGHWKDDKFYLFNSRGLPVRSEGTDQFHLRQTQAVAFDHHERHTRWIEASWMDESGVLYAWYHHEPKGICEAKEYHPDSRTHKLTAPKIGALRSENDGASFVDLGVILEAPSGVDCGAKNGFFAGGNGDFSVIRDRSGDFLYFLFSNYPLDVSQQGVAIARMAYADRDKPVGKVSKYRDGAWKEPGLGGAVTPIFNVGVDWMREDADALWGPSVHWNTYLEQYVILLNRSCCTKGWPQEGIYVSFNASLDNPKGWSQPKNILKGPKKRYFIAGWYPSLLGLNAEAKETDKLAGRVARFYLGGHSKWEIVFSKED